MKYPTPNRVGKSHKSSKSYGNSKSPTGVNSPLRHQAGQIIPCDKRNERKALKTDDGGHWPSPHVEKSHRGIKQAPDHPLQRAQDPLEVGPHSCWARVVAVLAARGELVDVVPHAGAAGSAEAARKWGEWSSPRCR